MALPKQDEIEEPLLKEIAKAGGEAKPHDLYPRLRAYFPQIADADLALEVAGAQNAWTNRIQWARNALVKKGELYRGPYGLWRITPKGQQHILTQPPAPKPDPTPPREVVEPTHIRNTLSEHDDLQKVIAEMGRKLGKTVDTGSGVDYKHDVLWKDNAYKGPSHVWEICDRGNLDKDVAALTAAADPQKWGAKAILVVTGDNEYSSAQKKLAGKPVLVVRSEVVKRTAELVNSGDIEFVKSIFT